MVLGRHVERLKFLDVMFGDRPALSPPEIFYQRMLAGDPTEASDKAEEFLKERSLASYYDEVALKGLQLAQADADRGALDQERLKVVRDAAIEFASNLSDQDDRPAPKFRSTSSAEATSAVESVAEDAPYENLPVIRKEDLPPAWQGEYPLLCVAGRSLIDEAAAIMLGQLATAHGLTSRIEGPETLTTANIFRLQAEGVAMVCLIYMDGSGPAHMRYSVRRLRRKLPHATIILCCWLKDSDPAELERLLEMSKADLIANSLGQALDLASKAASHHLDGQDKVQENHSATSAA